MTRALVHSSKYSPGNMFPEDLDALFVARRALLEDVLKRVARSAVRREKHFLLLVAPRGAGKTHFVALAEHLLETEERFATVRRRLRIACLREEEWGVTSFLDLLLRVMEALAARYPDLALTDHICEIRALHARDPDRSRRLAEDVLTGAIKDQTLLLVCENLADIFVGLGVEGQQRWRAFIAEHPFWCILATTPSLFAGVQLQRAPFFGFFTIRQLEPLSGDEGLELLKRKARLEGRTEVARALETPVGRARAQAIHHLAQGNARACVVLSDFLRQESLDDLVQPFMQMVDDLTPYYQSRVAFLAPLQRKIVEYVTRLAKPATVKVIAAGCLVSPQSAAKQMGELARLNVLRRTPSGREAYYELAEPLMRLCFEAKDRRTRHLQLFVELLRYWFSPGLGRPAQSLECLEAAIKLEPNNAQAWESRAAALIGLERWDEATAAASRAIELAPASAAGYLLRCVALVRREGTPRALADLEQALSRDAASYGAEMLGAYVGLCLVAEVDARGPVAMARQLPPLLELMQRYGAEATLPAALVVLARSDRICKPDDETAWAEALRLLLSILGGLPHCRVAIGIISVLVRTGRERERARLELPTEVRQLIDQLATGRLGAAPR